MDAVGNGEGLGRLVDAVGDGPGLDLGLRNASVRVLALQQKVSFLPPIESGCMERTSACVWAVTEATSMLLWQASTQVGVSRGVGAAMAEAKTEAMAKRV